MSNNSGTDGTIFKLLNNRKGIIVVTTIFEVRLGHVCKQKIVKSPMSGSSILSNVHNVCRI